MIHPTLVVLAAGMGSRYGGLKQLDPVGPSGEFILDYSVYDAIKAGFKKVVFIIRSDIEEIFKEKIGSRYEGKIEVHYAFQELHKLPTGFKVPEGRSKPWGTGHALLMVKGICNEPFVVINADDYYGPSSFQVAAKHFNGYQNQNTVYAIPAFFLKNTLSDHGSVSRGVCTVKNGHLDKIVERTHIEKDNGKIIFKENDEATELQPDTLVSMNMWGIYPNFFEEIETQFIEFLQNKGSELKSEFYLPFAIDAAIQKQLIKVKVYESVDQWFGVTYPEDKEAVIVSINEKVQSNIYPENLWKL